MKALIVYFSQTGNTEQAARAIGCGLEDAGVEAVAVRPLADVGPGAWLDCDLVGLGTPVFYYREPDNVRAWIRALEPRAEPAPVFTFNTNGGNPCNTLRRIAKMLRRKGGRVLASFECFGYDTYPIYLKSFRQWGHPDADDLARARAFGRDVQGAAARFLAGDDVPEASYAFVGGKTFRLSWICRKPILDGCPWLFPRLEVAADLCTRCGACARTCPTQNITIEQNGPRFANRCIHCHLCERVCPQNAIQCDWTRLTRMLNPDEPAPAPAAADA